MRVLLRLRLYRYKINLAPGECYQRANKTVHLPQKAYKAPEFAPGCSPRYFKQSSSKKIFSGRSLKRPGLRTWTLEEKNRLIHPEQLCLRACAARYIDTLSVGWQAKSGARVEVGAVACTIKGIVGQVGGT